MYDKQDMNKETDKQLTKRLLSWQKRSDLLMLLQLYFICTLTAYNTNVSYAFTKQKFFLMWWFVVAAL